MSEKNLAEKEAKVANPQGAINRPALWTLAKIWMLIGGQSFGGGTSTLFLIRREFMIKRGWITDEDYARFSVLCQLAPGPNLIALTILIGQKLRGMAGVAVSLYSMLLPSTIITVLLAAGFNAIQNWPPLQAMLKGVQPATAGILLVITIQSGLPLLKKAQAEGRISLILTLIILASSAMLVGLLHLSVALVLVWVGAFSAVAFARAWTVSETKKVP